MDFFGRYFSTSRELPLVESLSNMVLCGYGRFPEHAYIRWPPYRTIWKRRTCKWFAWASFSLSFTTPVSNVEMFLEVSRKRAKTKQWGDVLLFHYCPFWTQNLQATRKIGPGGNELEKVVCFISTSQMVVSIFCDEKDKLYIIWCTSI